MISAHRFYFMFCAIPFLLLTSENATAQLQPVTVSYIFDEGACRFPESPIQPEGISASLIMTNNVGCHAGLGHISRLWTDADSVREDQYIGFVLAAEEGEMLSFTEMDTLSIAAGSGTGIKIQLTYVVEGQSRILGDTTLIWSNPLPKYTFPIGEPFSADSIEIRIYGYDNDNVSEGAIHITEISLTLRATNIRVSKEDEGTIPNTLNTPTIYPNPALATTTISFNVSVSGNTRFVIYDLLGREVSTLVDKWLSSGSHILTWDSTPHASGVYVYHLQVGNQDVVGKMLVAR